MVTGCEQGRHGVRKTEILTPMFQYVGTWNIPKTTKFGEFTSNADENLLASKTVFSLGTSWLWDEVILPGSIACENAVWNLMKYICNSVTCINDYCEVFACIDWQW